VVENQTFVCGPDKLGHETATNELHVDVITINEAPDS
jgi:hypothetical protein